MILTQEKHLNLKIKLFFRTTINAIAETHNVIPKAHNVI